MEGPAPEARSNKNHTQQKNHDQIGQLKLAEHQMASRVLA